MNKELYNTLSNLSPEDKEFLIAYHNAIPRARAVIDKVLYNEDNPEIKRIVKGLSDGLYTVDQACELLEAVQI